METIELHVLSVLGTIHKDASRNPKNCGISKCPNCNFHTNSSDELNVHFKNKQCSCQNISLHADEKHIHESSKTLHRKVNIKSNKLLGQTTIKISFY